MLILQLYEIIFRWVQSIMEHSVTVSAPHSYNGRGLKYAYRVIVATQRLNQSIASLRIPFRVISVSSLNLNEIEVNDIICYKEYLERPSFIKTVARHP